MARVLIIGYGNPLRGDDAFGWRAVEALQRSLAAKAGGGPHAEIETLTVQQLTPELMDSLSRVELAIFIDAADGTEPGLLSQREVAPASAGPASFTHHSTPEALLAGAAALYGRAPTAFMITVVGADFSLSTEVSPAVAARLDEAVETVLRLIA